MSGVSIVIPVYNRQAAAVEALRSAMAQMRPSDELVVVDDGSDIPFVLPDGIVDNPSVKLLRHASNRGAAEARNTGIDAARGPWVAFLDSDDLWLAGKLRAQVGLAGGAVSPDRAIACGFRRIDRVRPRGEEDLLPVPAAGILAFSSGCWFAPGSTLLVPKASFEQVGGFDGRLERLEDLDWFMRFALKGGRLDIAPVIGSLVRVGGRPAPEPVERARNTVLGKWNTADTPLDANAMRHLKAYLALECASANFHAGSLARGARFLAASFMHVPRSTLPLRRWWQSSDESPAR